MLVASLGGYLIDHTHCWQIAGFVATGFHRQEVARVKVVQGGREYIAVRRRGMSSTGAIEKMEIAFEWNFDLQVADPRRSNELVS